MFPAKRDSFFLQLLSTNKLITQSTLAQSRGSSGNFIYFNTGEKATVFGLELRGKRQSLIKNMMSRYIKHQLVILPKCG